MGIEDHLNKHISKELSQIRDGDFDKLLSEYTKEDRLAPILELFRRQLSNPAVPQEKVAEFEKALPDKLTQVRDESLKAILGFESEMRGKEKIKDALLRKRSTETIYKMIDIKLGIIEDQFIIWGKNFL